LIINSVQEIAQNPKTALAVTSITTVSGFIQWFEANISLMSGIVGLTGSIILVVIQIKRNSREKKEHELDVKLKEKELNG
jgi:hypothetical protein